MKKCLGCGQIKQLYRLFCHDCLDLEMERQQKIKEEAEVLRQQRLNRDG